jgi:hypothetical protein
VLIFENKYTSYTEVLGSSPNLTKYGVYLQNRIIELEKQKKEKEELDKLSKNDIDFNFKILNEILVNTRSSIESDRYSRNVPLARFYDECLLKRLDAIFNILNMLNMRVSKLELA